MEKNKSQIIINKIQYICLFLFSLIWYISESRNTGKKYAIVILLIFASIELLRILKAKKMYFNKALYVFGVFIIYCMTSYIWAINGEIVIEKSFNLITEFGFLFLGYQFFLHQEDGEKNIKNMLKIIMYLGFFFSIYIVNFYGINKFIKMLLNGEGIGWGIGNTNTIGMKTCISFLIFLYFAIFDKKFIYYFLLLLPLIVSLGTGSKKVLIMIVVGTFFLIFMYRRKITSLKSIFKFVIIASLIVVIATSVFNSTYFNRIFKRFKDMLNDFNGSSRDGSTYLRKVYIQAGIKSFLNHPLFGIGLNNSGYLTLTVSSNFTYLHNNYIELLATTGIIGFLLYYYNYFYIIFNCLKNKRKYTEMIIIMFMLLLIVEVGAVTYVSIDMCWYLLVGYIASGKEKLIKNNNEEIKNVKKNIANN